MRWWLIDLPAALLDAWFTFYRILLTIVTIATIAIGITALTLWFGFGIRWGW